MSVSALLLVDDERALAELLKKYLERLGFQVDAVTHPREALDLVEKNPARYALLITDLTLPEMNGEVLIERVRERIPDLPAILTSGYAQPASAPSVEFLQKPFLPKMLAEAIERLLGERSA